MQLEKNAEGHYVISEEEYENVVSLCKRIYTATKDLNVLDPKRKFTSSERYPTVEELKEHQIRARFELYFPYLVYYEDVFQSTDPEFRRTREYIADILYDMMEMT